MNNAEIIVKVQVIWMNNGSANCVSGSINWIGGWMLANNNIKIVILGLGAVSGSQYMPVADEGAPAEWRVAPFGYKGYLPW